MGWFVGLANIRAIERSIVQQAGELPQESAGQILVGATDLAMKTSVVGFLNKNP